MTSIYDAELLLVDDNPDLLRLLCEQLSGAGYHHIRTAATCAAARAAFDAAPPHLMVLDINLPDGDGFSLFRALRARADVPALFLSARDADADRLFGLARGASQQLTLGDRIVQLNDALVQLPDGSALPLTATELALLRKLAENRGHIVTYDALCEAVWGADYYGCENSLNVHIRHLREKLEPLPGRPQFLRTVRGIGYKLAGEVRS